VEWADCVRVIDLPNDQCRAVLRLNDLEAPETAEAV